MLSRFRYFLSDSSLVYCTVTVTVTGALDRGVATSENKLVITAVPTS
jgi:hypothetical protein